MISEVSSKLQFSLGDLSISPIFGYGVLFFGFFEGRRVGVGVFFNGSAVSKDKIKLPLFSKC